MRCFGHCRVCSPRSSLIASGQIGIAPFPLPVIRISAFCELLGVVGILAPRLVGGAEFLSPAAAGGFVIVMVGAIASYAHLREPHNVALTVAIFIAAVTVAVGRVLIR
jgi:hypothetical protein